MKISEKIKSLFDSKKVEPKTNNSDREIYTRCVLVEKIKQYSLYDFEFDVNYSLELKEFSIRSIVKNNFPFRIEVIVKPEEFLNINLYKTLQNKEQVYIFLKNYCINNYNLSKEIKKHIKTLN